MGLDAKHPSYTARLEGWIMMRDFYAGEERVKAKTTTYLPATKGMVLDGMGTGHNAKPKLGQEVYDAYLNRAVFPDYVKEAVEAYMGLLHQKDANIELPKVMEPLRDRATLYGEGLQLLLRRINEEQLVSGRLGLLPDLPPTPDPANPLPYIALYAAETVPNWDANEIGEGLSTLRVVVLNESGFEMNSDFEWVQVMKYRVLMRGDVLATNAENPDETVVTGSVYRVGVFKSEGTGVPTFVASDMIEPKLRGQTLEEIPFVFVNAKDITPQPDEPPLMGLARLCKAIYQGEADLRQNLFMQGQDTLVISGERKKTSTENAMDESALRTGAGSVIELEQGGTAEYVGVTANGLGEQRQTIADDRLRAETRSGQLISTKSAGGGVESGDALKTRVAAQTATLNQLAKTGAAALEAVLKKIAVWMGANPDEVKVTPNLEFADFQMTGENLVKLMNARSLGAPLSRKSIHDLMVDQGLTKMDFDEEMELIAQEDAEFPVLTGTTAGGTPPAGGAGGNQGAAPGKPGTTPAPKGGRPAPGANR